MNKTFNGKAIYNPIGKAGEYSYWACNFYIGCSGGCTYCYCKKGIVAKQLGGDEPVLKKCLKDPDTAFEIFNNELLRNIDELRKHGLFFSFTTEPFLMGKTTLLYKKAIDHCWYHKVPVKVLTKQVSWINEYWLKHEELKSLFAIGFTLTGHDELEHGCSTNKERIEGMKKLHDLGFITWASIEPIIDLQSSFDMIRDTNGICDLYKIGLLSGKKYDKEELYEFVGDVINKCLFFDAKIYFKDSLLKMAGIKREDLSNICVSRDYNIFG